MIRTARRLGVVLREAKTPEDDDTGILMVKRTYDATEEHAVVYVKDTIFNPRDGEWWTDLEAFLRDRNWEIASFLRRVK